MVDDANAMFHNPAGLAYIKKKIFNVSTSYEDYTVHMSWLDKWGEDWNYSYYDKRIFVSYIDPTSKFTYGISSGVKKKVMMNLELKNG